MIVFLVSVIGWLRTYIILNLYSAIPEVRDSIDKSERRTRIESMVANLLAWVLDTIIVIEIVQYFLRLYH